MPFDGVDTISPASLQKIDAVIDLLSTPDKWCKGALKSHDGRYCIRGAVRAVDAAEVLEPAILHAIGEIGGQRFRRIESFNDHPNTSHDQVLSVLYRARDRLQSGETGDAGFGPPQVPSAPVGLRATLRRWLGR